MVEQEQAIGEYGAALIDYVSGEYQQELMGTAKRTAADMQTAFVAYAESAEWSLWDDDTIGELVDELTDTALQLVFYASLLDHNKNKSDQCSASVMDTTEEVVVHALRIFDTVSRFGAAEPTTFADIGRFLKAPEVQDEP